MSLRDQKDELFKFLNSRGYMPILVPRGGMIPPTVFVLQDDRYIRVRDLTDLLKGRPDRLNMLKPTTAPAIELSKEMAKKKGGNVSVTLLGRLLGRFGLAGAPEIKAAIDAGDDLNFNFEDVTTVGVAPGRIQDAIADIDPGHFGTSDLQAGRVHIAYEYLLARKVDIQSGNSFKGKVELSAEVSDAARFSAGAHSKGSSGESGTYSGKEPVAIAFKVGKLERESNHYLFTWEIKPGFGISPREAENEKYISMTGQVYEIEDKPAVAPS